MNMIEADTKLEDSWAALQIAKFIGCVLMSLVLK